MRCGFIMMVNADLSLRPAIPSDIERMGIAAVIAIEEMRHQIRIKPSMN